MVKPVQECINKASETVVHMTIAGAVGYFCSRAFNIINAAHGAAFCAISTVVSKVTSPFFDKFFNGPEANNSAKFIGAFLNTMVGVGVSATLATMAGFAISFNTALLLTCTIVAVEILTVLGLAFVNAACA